MHLSNWKRTTMDNELALIELVKKGDKKAYNALVLKYQDRLVYSVYKFLKDFHNDMMSRQLLASSNLQYGWLPFL